MAFHVDICLMGRKRIIFELEDGRKTYSMNTNGPELWTPLEVRGLILHLRQGVTYGFTEGFKFFGTEERLLKTGLRVLVIVDYHLEDESEPIKEEYLR